MMGCDGSRYSRSLVGNRLTEWLGGRQSPEGVNYVPPWDERCLRMTYSHHLCWGTRRLTFSSAPLPRLSSSSSQRFSVNPVIRLIKTPPHVRYQEATAVLYHFPSYPQIRALGDPRHLGLFSTISAG